jgi:two-component system, NtrC family, sensor kinase
MAKRERAVNRSAAGKKRSAMRKRSRSAAGLRKAPEAARLRSELAESRQYQTATAAILKVIARSASNLQAVLDTLVESAVGLAGANTGAIFQGVDAQLRLTALYGYTSEMLDYMRAHPIPRGKGNVGRVVSAGKTIHIPDVLADPNHRPFGDYQRVFRIRAWLGIPITREGRVEGVFGLVRHTPGPFTQSQIDVATTFADQAVIAIENARLFDEVQTKTRDLEESLKQQTATADVLKVISRSAFNLQNVLDTLVESATRLCQADQAWVFQRDGELFRFVASFGLAVQTHARIRSFFIPLEVRAERGSIVGRAVLEGRTVHVADVLRDPEYTWGKAQEIGGYRAAVGVPLLREGEVIGVVFVARNVPEPFTKKQIELVTTFADQAVIAIENVRLFEAEQARTRELAQSLLDLQIAQDRLVQTQKLASLGQLTAGIAHEIKNPLNFVNNFSALSSELLNELREVVQDTPLGEKARVEIDELTETLRSNLDRIEQHGKRADSIVKNMLLHSREGSGEHRPVEINAIIDESLNLAYHGARAEKQGFNIKLERDFDAAVGVADIYPQEITRVLLNLISNGFYAATKRAKTAGDGFEPKLNAITRNLGEKIEIRIRDNGTGIAPDIREKIFNPFFTTKPAGEGTGLGLSMSHDIIVKQHGGTIEVVTEPGSFTEFIITLPRTMSMQAKSEGRKH